MHTFIILFYRMLSYNDKRNIVTTNIFSKDVGNLDHKVHPVFLEFHSGNIVWTLALSAAPGSLVAMTTPRQNETLTKTIWTSCLDHP